MFCLFVFAWRPFWAKHLGIQAAFSVRGVRGVGVAMIPSQNLNPKSALVKSHTQTCRTNCRALSEPQCLVSHLESKHMKAIKRLNKSLD